MPRVRAEVAATETAGVYQFLVEREAAEHHDWVTNHVLGRGGQPYGRLRRLAALRAGQPVALALYEFPEWARPVPSPPRLSARAEMDQQKLAESVWTVYADDRLVRGVHDGASTAFDEFLDL